MRSTFRFLFLCQTALLLFFSSCNPDDSGEDTSTQTYTGISDSIGDYQWDSTEVKPVSLGQGAIRYGGMEGVQVNGSDVVITKPGTYQFAGVLTDGQIIVNCSEKGLVRLLLSGVNITCSNSSPLNVQDADRVLVYLMPQTINYLTDGTTFVFDDADAGEPDAALFSKADLVIAGDGSLVVDGNYKDGIAGKDGLLIKSGLITVTAADDGIRGRDCLQVKGGTITVTSSGDGMVSTNDEDLDWGYVTLDSCQMKITSGGDGIAAVKAVVVNSGSYQLTTGGGSGKTVSSAASAKGIKSGGKLTINDGTFTVSSADDALHAATSVEINGGTLLLASSDDGIHSDGAVLLNDGDFTLSGSYEGVEGTSITFNDGTWRVTASNDCLNATKGTVSGGTESNDGSSLVVNGGTVLLNISGSGDGIDSNGNLTINGGTLVVQGPSSSPEVAMDFNGTMTMNGGVLIGTGPNSGNMIQPTSSNYSSSSAQFTVVASLSSAVSSSSWLHLQDASGVELATFKPLRSAYYFIFSSPALKSGSSCLVYTGGSYSGTTGLNGFYTGGTYSGGTLQKTLSVASSKLVSSVSSSSGGGGGKLW